MSTSWLLALPTAQGSLSAPIFKEGVATVLSLHSTACLSKLGERIGGSRMDEWGDVVRCENLPGGSWTIRHDKTKAEFLRILRWGWIVSSCEVTGLCSTLFPLKQETGLKLKANAMSWYLISESSCLPAPLALVLLQVS